MARQIRNRTKQQRYEERIKAGKKFYLFLFKLFISAAIICSAGLGYLWFWLARYEARSPQGAIRSYLKLVEKRKFDKIYDNNVAYFQELNSEDSVTAYLISIYDNRQTWGMTTSLIESDENRRIYNVYYEKMNICQLELVKPEKSPVWQVRTVNKNGTYQFDSLNQAGFKINGTSIQDHFNSIGASSPAAYADLGLDEKLPDVTRYSISGFIWYPIVEADDPNNTAVIDHSVNTVYIGPKATDEQYAEFAQKIQDTAFAYSQYITKDGTFNNLNQHLYPNTTFYKNMAGFNNQWFSSHNTFEYRNINVHDVMPLGENAFIGSISYDYIVSSSSVTKTYSNSYQLLFIRNSKGVWKLINLVLTDDAPNTSTDDE